MLNSNTSKVNNVTSKIIRASDSKISTSIQGGKTMLDDKVSNVRSLINSLTRLKQ